MPTPTKGPRLGGSPAHQKAILANLATSLFEHGSITTTEAKARRLRPFAERLISKAKRGDLHNRRQVLSVIRDKTVVHVLFTEIGPRYAERPGGYLRITKIGPRKGDNAPMAVISLVEAEFVSKVRSTRSAPRSTTETTSTVAVGGATADVVAADGSSVEPAEEQVDEQSAGSVGGHLDAEDEQVGAQDAVAAQESIGETVTPVADVTSGASAAEPEVSEAPSEGAAAIISEPSHNDLDAPVPAEEADETT